MKPKPFSLLNHFTVPVATGAASSGLARPPVWRPQVAGAHDERVARTFARPPIRAESVLHGPGRQLGTTVAVAVVPRLRSGRGLLHFSVPSRSRGPAAGMRWALLQSPGAE